MQLYTDKDGATVIKGDSLIRGELSVQTGYTPRDKSKLVQNDITLTQDLMEKIKPRYTMKSTVKTWYATLHIAGNIDVAKAFIQKKILNDGACFQIAPCDYVYSGGCEQGMTIRCIHYPRFPVNGPDTLLGRLMFLASELAAELGQKSYTIETVDNTIYFDNGNKHD